MQVVSIGRVTLALSLMAVGAGILLESLGVYPAWGVLQDLWPLVFIVLGMETLYRVRQADRSETPVTVTLDYMSLLALLILMLVVNSPDTRFFVRRIRL